MAKSWNFRGVGGSMARPSGTENPGGWGVKLEKPSVRGMDIFWNHTLVIKSFLCTVCMGNINILYYIQNFTKIWSFLEVIDSDN